MQGKSLKRIRSQSKRHRLSPTEGTEFTVRTVALLGLFGVENYGNQASLAAAVDALRRHRPAVRLMSICHGTDEVRSTLQIEAESLFEPDFVWHVVPKRRWARICLFPLLEVARWIGAYRVMKRVDVVVVPGTGQLDDFGVAPYQMPLVLFRWAVAARAARTPISLVSVGAGPIDHPVSRWLMVRFAKSASFRTYRDPGSVAFMGLLGAPGALAPDVVFANGIVDVRHQKMHQSDRRVIGLGVMAYYGWRNDPVAGDEAFQQYMRKLEDLARGLLNEGFDLRLIIGESTDSTAAAHLLKRLNSVESERVRIASVSCYKDVLEATSGCEVCIVTRYHGLVASLLTLRPTVSIEYAEKNSDLMVAVGLGDFCHRIGEFDVKTVFDDVYRAMITWEEREPTVRRRVKEWSNQVDTLFVEALERCHGE